MDSDVRLCPSLVPPSPDEATALQIVGTYLIRAGSHAARHLFAEEAGADAEQLAQLSDRLLAGALLCADLAALPDASRRG